MQTKDWIVEAPYLTVVGDLEARLLGVAEDGCYGFRGHRRHVGDVELEVRRRKMKGE